MRILSVVTLVSPLGEYGGPLRVAINQAVALRNHGHEVTLAGAARGYSSSAPESVEGVPLVLLPARTLVPGIGFAGLGSPGLWRWLHRHVRDYDVVHIHAARDLVTLPAARIAMRQQVPYVLQTHGMIDASSRVLAAPLDLALTRPVLRGAHAVMYLTEVERRDLQSVAPGVELVHLPNGVPTQPVVARAQRTTVLYLARLAARKRPVVFVEAATRVSRVVPGIKFVMVGPDEGEGPAVRAAINKARADGTDIVWEGAVPPEETLDVMTQASLYVLPSVDEPYPMSVLEAMAVGLPVIVTDTCGLAEVVSSAGAGLVVDASVESLSDAIRQLAEDPARARLAGREGRAYVRHHHAMATISSRLVDCYSR